MVGNHPFSWAMFTFTPNSKGDNPLSMTAGTTSVTLLLCSTTFHPSLSSRLSNTPNLRSVVLYVRVCVFKTSSSKEVNKAPVSICKAPFGTTLGASVASGLSVINSGLSSCANAGKDSSIIKRGSPIFFIVSEILL